MKEFTCISNQRKFIVAQVSGDLALHHQIADIVNHAHKQIIDYQMSSGDIWFGCIRYNFIFNPEPDDDVESVDIILQEVGDDSELTTICTKP